MESTNIQQDQTTTIPNSSRKNGGNLLTHVPIDVPIESIINHDELTDIRAYQRTFDGAYTRTALGQLSYAILILRLFERSFYWCGLIYTILAVQLVLIGIYRYNLAVSNDDRWKDVNVRMVSNDIQHDQEEEHPVNGINDTNGGGDNNENEDGIGDDAIVAHTAHRSIFRPTFRTAGSVVALATAGTFLLEIALMVLVIRM